MPVHVTLPYFTVSGVVAFRKRQAIAHAPANFAVASIAKACDLPYVQKVHASECREWRLAMSQCPLLATGRKRRPEPGRSRCRPRRDRVGLSGLAQEADRAQ